MGAYTTGMKITDAEYRENRREARKIHIPQETIRDVVKLIAFVITAIAALVIIQM